VARILILSNMYPPHHYGGYELSCRDVADRWRQGGHEVTVLTGTMRVAGVEDPPGERSLGVQRDLEIFFRDGLLSAPPLARRPAVERANQRVLGDCLARVQPDVVSLWHMGAMSTGLITTVVRGGLPLVYVVCDDWPTYAHKIDPWMKLWYRWPRIGRRVERLTGLPATLPDIGRSGLFCFVSANTRDRCTKFSPWFYPDSTVTYSGIDHADFPVVAKGPDHAWHWKLMTAGRLDPRKGMETAIRALVLLPREARLELVVPVDDPYGSVLKGLIAELGVGDRVVFSTVPRPQMAGRYAEADVCLFPIEWEEPFGLVPLEAMAGGIPVVATGSGGSGEFLVDGDNCLRIPPRDPAALAAAIRRLASDHELRQHLVEGGWRTAEQLSVDRLAEILEQWHVAAAEHFARGRPAHRFLDLAVRPSS
jgi:glycosyltransferase involved in cell wall biosynthesis